MNLLTLKAFAWALAAKLALIGAWVDEDRAGSAETPQLVERDPGWREPPDRPRPRPDRDYLPFLTSPAATVADQREKHADG